MMIGTDASLGRIPAPVYEFFASSLTTGKLRERLQVEHRLSRSEAEDVLADALVIASKDFASLSDRSRLDEWIWAIVLDQIWKRAPILRREKSSHVSDRVLRSLRDLDSDPAAYVQTLQMHDRVYDAFEKFEQDREKLAIPLRLFLLDQLTISEIAGILGMSQHTVKKYLSIARVEFRRYLQRAGLIPNVE